MKLERLQKKFENRLNTSESQFSEFLSSRESSDFLKSDVHQLEGWLSEFWQNWCRFCRIAVFKSCTGCISKNAVVIPAAHAAANVVSFIACKQKRGVPPSSNGTNDVLRKEPTWGHIDKLLEIIQALGPINATTLSAGFGTVPKIDDIRLIRNAAAHRNIENHKIVISLGAAYLAHPINHPIEALLWIDRDTNQTLIQSRIEDMKIASRNVCL